MDDRVNVLLKPIICNRQMLNWLLINVHHLALIMYAKKEDR